MRDKKGQVLVELALVLPLLLAFIFAMIDYGRIVYAKNCLVTAARAAARAAVMTNGLTTPVSGVVSDGSSIGDAAKKNLVTVDDGSVTYEIECYDVANKQVTGQAQPGDRVKITIRHPQFSLLTPFSNMLAIVTQSTPMPNSLALSGEASMSKE